MSFVKWDMWKGDLTFPFWGGISVEVFPAAAGAFFFDKTDVPGIL